MYACAALCAAGLVAGGLRVVDELALQVVTPRAAVADSLIAICVGIVLGLWLPRRVIRRRLGTRGSNGTDATGPVDFEFAASLTGGLIIALGVLWVLLMGLIAGLEGYRALLTQHFVHPAWLTRGLVTLPVWIGLVALGGMTAVVLSALHGWQRLAGSPNAGVARLWLVMLAGGGLAAAVASVVERPLVAALLAPVATFAASIVAVLHKPTGAAHSEATPARSVPLSRLAPALLSAGLLAALSGVALGLATPTWLTMPVLASQTTWLLSGALVGVLVGHIALRLVHNGGVFGPFLVLTTALVWGLPMWPTLCADLGHGPCRAVVTIALTTACIALTARRVGELFRRLQPTFAWVGGVTATGLACGLALCANFLPAGRDGGVALIVALVATAGAGLELILDRSVGTRLRTAGLAGVGLWLLLLMWHGDATSRATAVNEHVAGPLLTVNDNRTMRVGVGPAALPNAWGIDLGGLQWDTIIIATDTQTTNLTPAQARVLLRRCARALRVGGRLGIEEPAGPLTKAALRLSPVGGLARDSAPHEIRIVGPQRVETLLMIGRDVPAWLAQQALPPGVEAECRPRRAVATSQPS